MFKDETERGRFTRSGLASARRNRKLTQCDFIVSKTTCFTCGHIFVIALFGYVLQRATRPLKGRKKAILNKGSIIDCRLFPKLKQGCVYVPPLKPKHKLPHI